MEDVHSAVIGGGGEEGVAAVEGHPPQRLLVVAQGPVGLGGQVQVKPCQAIVLQIDHQSSHAQHLDVPCSPSFFPWEIEARGMRLKALRVA